MTDDAIAAMQREARIADITARVERNGWTRTSADDWFMLAEIKRGDEKLAEQRAEIARLEKLALDSASRGDER